MAKNESTVSKAEQYRKERKARIAKSAKKSAKKNSSGNSGSEVIIARIIGIVFAVAVVVGISFLLLNNFGVFERIIPVYKVGDVSISEAEYTYQLRTTYSQLSSMSEQYTQYYGSNILGFDTTKSPDEQKYTADDEAPTDEEAAESYEGDKYDTWMDYIIDTSIIGIQERKALCSEAAAAGIKLDEEDLKEIDDAINELEASVLENSATSATPTSLKGYLKNAYGNGMTLKLFRELQEEASLAAKYQEHKQKEFYDSYSADEIKKVYEEDKATYDVVDYRSYSVAFTDKKSDDSKALSKADAKKRADEFLSKITNEASFNKLADKYAKADNKDSTTYEDKDATLTKGATGTNLDEKVKNWVYADGRKAGDKKVFELESNYYIIYVVTPAHETYAYNSRHILLSPEDTEKATDDDWKALLKEAEELRDEWKAGDATEDSFAELAKEHSTDTGSAEEGGLCENITPGSFVSEYEDWCLDSNRKEGDVGIIKSQYGYHIIYFISINDKPVWNDTIRSEKSTEDYTDYHKEILDKAEYKYVLNNKRVDSCAAETLSYIELMLEQTAAMNSSYSN